ncbi:hypothetical protein EYF80_040303 [Liparis tanakae]|uniref:Uncharacterized protein n=1 Tax=Liparis tanakae TaxID=230148 RepID=A0A4Z2G7N1_9TELE|nr:hypothetical protein EYF80_040303 [Liparis tanakae]
MEDTKSTTNQLCRYFFLIFLGSRMISVLSSNTMPVRKFSTRSMRKKVSDTTLKMIHGVVVSSLKKVMPTGMMIRLPTMNISMTSEELSSVLEQMLGPHSNAGNFDFYKFIFEMKHTKDKLLLVDPYLKSLYGWIIQFPADFTRSCSFSTAFWLPNMRRENLFTPGCSMELNCRCMYVRLPRESPSSGTIREPSSALVKATEFLEC